MVAGRPYPAGTARRDRSVTSPAAPAATDPAKCDRRVRPDRVADGERARRRPGAASGRSAPPTPSSGWRCASTCRRRCCRRPPGRGWARPCSAPGVARRGGPRPVRQVRDPRHPRRGGIGTACTRRAPRPRASVRRSVTFAPFPALIAALTAVPAALTAPMRPPMTRAAALNRPRAARSRPCRMLAAGPHRDLRSTTGRDRTPDRRGASSRGIRA